MSTEVLKPIGDDLESIVDCGLKVDNTLRGRGAAGSWPVHTNLPEDMWFTSAESVDEPVVGLEMGRRVSITDRERRNMSLAEIEQCSFDNFWGMVTFKAQQEKASAEMEAEDRRSQAVQEKIKKEELHALWDEEELRTREMRSAVKARLEHAARLEYLEVMGGLTTYSLAPRQNTETNTHSSRTTKSGKRVEKTNVVDAVRG